MRYQEKVQRMRMVEEIETMVVPEELVKLVNSNDAEYGRNGYHYLGCQRKRQGGYTIDRLQSYVNHHNTSCIDHNHPCHCPIKPPRLSEVI